MKHEKIWKYTCFFVALALILYGVHLARIDAVLHGACKKQLYYSRFATYGLYLFCLTAAALLLYAVWLWIAEARVHNGACGVSLCVFGCGISGLSCRGLPAFDGIRTEKISIAVRKRTFLRFEGSFSIIICRNRERVLHMRKTGKFCRFIGSFLSFVQYYA